MWQETEQRKKQRLVESGADALAEAFIRLARVDSLAEDWTDRMLATPEENIQRFRTKLAALSQPARYISWRESARFACHLRCILEDIKAGAEDPLTGVELIIAFYETDKWVFEMCDDSGGDVSDVYREDARLLFTDYAQRCTDKKSLVRLLLKLNQENEYGVRDTLIHCAAEYLSESGIRMMIVGFLEMLQNSTEKESSFRKQDWSILVGSLIHLLHDASLGDKPS